MKRLLSALVGGLLGAVVSLTLVMMWGVASWWVLAPAIVGLVVGLVGGDRGLLALMHWVGRSP